MKGMKGRAENYKQARGGQVIREQAMGGETGDTNCSE